MKKLLALLLLPALINTAAPAAAVTKVSDAALMTDAELLQVALESGKKLQEYQEQIHDKAESAVEIDDNDCQTRLLVIVPCLPKELLGMIMKYGKPRMPLQQWPGLSALVKQSVTADISDSTLEVFDSLGTQVVQRWPQSHADVGLIMNKSEGIIFARRSSVSADYPNLPPDVTLRTYLAACMMNHSICHVLERIKNVSKSDNSIEALSSIALMHEVFNELKRIISAQSLSQLSTAAKS